jgi:dihydroorotase
MTAEVTPHHLYFAAPDAYERLGALAQVNPPIRSDEHRQALRAAFSRGFFDLVGSDHAPHMLSEKSTPYPASPSGLPGVQTLCPVMLTLLIDDGLSSLRRFVEMACETPARVYGLEGKGRLEPGYDADLTIVDLQAKRAVDCRELQSKCGWSPFEGEVLRGWPVHTVVAGLVVVRDRTLFGTPVGTKCRFRL